MKSIHVEINGYFDCFFDFLLSSFRTIKPTIHPNATWSTCAVTIIDNNTISSAPHGIFIDSNDTVYVADHSSSQILIWANTSTDPGRILTEKLIKYASLFVTAGGDIYMENGNEIGRIDKWTLGATASKFVTNFSESCRGLFVDISNSLYCSAHGGHHVVKVPLESNTSTMIIVAGMKGTSGSASNQLNGPWGIFVDVDFNLYVADSANDRIQLFRLGQLSGTTVAGGGKLASLQLKQPTDVILDGDGLLYIADCDNHRIIRAGHSDFQCLVGCTYSTSGSASNQIHNAYSVRFDSYGNVYVADEYNNRIQKFRISEDTCGKSHNRS